MKAITLRHPWPFAISSYEALVRRYNDGFSIILWSAKRAWKFDA